MRKFAIFIFYFWDLLSFLILNLAKIRYSTKKVCRHNYTNTSQQNFVKLQVKDILYRCAYFPEYQIHFFSGIYVPVEPKNVAKIKVTTEAVCHRNTSETAQQFFM